MSGALITSRFNAESTTLDVVQGLELQGRQAVVTGGASGFGVEIARALAVAGASVTIADVDAHKGAQTAAQLTAEAGGAPVSFASLDLASLAAVRAFAADYSRMHDKLDILINNAGVMACPLMRTKDGHEFQFGVNYLGHWMLAKELLPLLERAAPSRIVSVSSIGHRRSDIHFDDIDYLQRPYDKWEAYGQSKTACALFAVAFSERFLARGVTCNAVNPGGSMTALHRHLTREEMMVIGFLDAQGQPPSRWRSPAQCASTAVWLATAPDLGKVGGRFFEECREARPWDAALPMEGVRDYALSVPNANRLWQLSETMTRS
jgi:NAD(P)-dependent dehydrogenase (short-subunit alcohol dehydrogenase family)